MARIPTLTNVETRAPGIVGEAFAPMRSNVDADAFGASSYRALAGVGESIQQTAGRANEMLVQQRQIENETAATTAQTEFQRQAGAMWGEYSNLQGQAAVDAYPQFQENLRGLQERIIGGAGNQRLRAQLERSIGTSAASIYGQAATLNGRNVRDTGVQAQAGAASQAVNDAVTNRGDPSQVGMALFRGMSAVENRARLEGWTPEYTESQRAAYRGQFYGSVIGAVATTDPLAAQVLFDANKQNMDAQSQIRIANALREPVIQRQALNIVTNLTTSGNPPVAAPGTPGNSPAAGYSDPVAGQAARAEGGTNPDGTPRQNAAGSSASGPLQITDGTWGVYAARLGLRPDQRNDKAAHEQVWAAYQSDARREIGRDLTPAEQYSAWLLGIAGAKAFITAGPNADAYELYRSAAGPEIADKAFRQNGNLLRRGATVGESMQAIETYFNRQGSGGQRATTGQQDRSQVMSAALAQAGNDPDMQRAVMSQLRTHYATEDALMASDRARMQQRIEDLGNTLSTGGQVNIPSDEIRRLFQPAQADAILDTLSTKQVEGDVFRAVQLATPETITQMRDDLANGTGEISANLRQRRGTVVAADGSVPEEERAGDLAARTSVQSVLNRAVEARAQQLQRDPAQYVVADPAVRASLEAVQADPNSREAMQNYVTTTLAAQARMGVPEQNRRVLTVNAAASEAAKLMNQDPGGPGAQPDNAALRLQQMARSYGSSWPRVFADLVRDGKLPAEYQVLANIPSPVGQADYQRTLQAIQRAGGMQQFRSSVPEQPRKQVDDGLDQALDGFRTSTLASGTTGAVDLYRNVRDSVQQLAYYYALNGRDGATAIRDATDRVLNDKYEFSGTMRVPRQLPNGQVVGMNNVRTSTTFVMRNLKPEDLAAPVGADPALNESDRRRTAWQAAQRGNWVPNQDDTGLVLMSPRVMGGTVPVRRNDGSMVEIKFNNLPQQDGTIPGINPRRFTSPGRRQMQFGGEAAPEGFYPEQAPASGLPTPPVPPENPPAARPDTPAPGAVQAPVAGTQATPRLNNPGARGQGRWTAPGVN